MTSLHASKFSLYVVRSAVTSDRSKLALPWSSGPPAKHPTRLKTGLGASVTLVSYRKQGYRPFARFSRGLQARASAGSGSLHSSQSQSQIVGQTGQDTLQRVVIPTAVVLLLCNVDRICMSIAILPLAQELAWSPSTQGIVQAAFLWGYTLTQIAGGALADRYGGRIVIAWAMAWFSVASLLLPTALHPRVVAGGWALPAVLLARAAVGFGEGVVLPAMSNLMATRVPSSWRASALGLVYSGFHTGNPTGLILSPLIMASFGWRAIFYTFGAVGLPLLLAWIAIVPPAGRGGLPAFSSQLRSAPAGVPDALLQTPEAAGAPRQRLSTLSLMSKPASWAIIIVNTVNHWGYFIFLSWLPSYFHRSQGLNLQASSLSAFIPWATLALCSSAAGFVADRLLARGMAVATVRKRLQSIAFLVPAAMLLLLARPGVSARAAVSFMTLALGATSLSQFVANMSDIAPSYAGQLFGICNTFGCLAAIVGVSAAGFIVESTGSFEAVFKLTAALYVAAVFAWNVLCSGDTEFPASG